MLPRGVAVNWSAVLKARCWVGDTAAEEPAKLEKWIAMPEMPGMKEDAKRSQTTDEAYAEAGDGPVTMALPGRVQPRGVDGVLLMDGSLRKNLGS
jgi:hypothetical protein